MLGTFRGRPSVKNTLYIAQSANINICWLHIAAAGSLTWNRLVWYCTSYAAPALLALRKSGCTAVCWTNKCANIFQICLSSRHKRNIGLFCVTMNWQGFCLKLGPLGFKIPFFRFQVYSVGLRRIDGEIQISCLLGLTPSYCIPNSKIISDAFFKFPNYLGCHLIQTLISFSKFKWAALGHHSTIVKCFGLIFQKEPRCQESCARLQQSANNLFMKKLILSFLNMPKSKGLNCQTPFVMILKHVVALSCSSIYQNSEHWTMWRHQHEENSIWDG